jgi:Fe-S-cluster-containing dehydrogenase component
MVTKDSFNRRRFIQIVLGSGAAISALSVLKKTSASEGGSGPEQWAMVIDLEKCTGCEYCTKVCQANNDIPPEIEWNKVTHWGAEGGRRYHLPQPCMHCEEAPCVSQCPVKATYYRDDGIVMMNYDRCIGCRYCEVACPYGARSFNWSKFEGENPVVPEWGSPEVQRRPRGVVEKCSFCFQRIDRGKSFGLEIGKDPLATPACVVACPVEARIFGDLNDPESKVSQIIRKQATYRLREDLGTKPRVYYLFPGNHSMESEA